MNLLSQPANDVLSFTTSLWKGFTEEKIERRSSLKGASQLSTKSIETVDTVESCTSDDEHDLDLSSTSRHSISEPPAQPTLDDIRVLLQEWKYCMISGDARDIASRYAPNAVLVPMESFFGPGPLKGQQAIKDYYEHEFLPQHRPKDIKVLHGNLSVSKEQQGRDERDVFYGQHTWAQDTGIYDITTGTTILRMRYTFLYRRENRPHGKWRIVRHTSTKLYEIVVDPRTKLPKSTATTTSTTKSTPPARVEDPSTVIPWGAFPFEDQEDEFTDHSTRQIESREPSPSEVNHLVGLIC